MIIPPLPTPFDSKGDLDAEAYRDLAKALEPHVDGLLFYGSNGEGVHLTREERAKGLEVQSPQKPVWVGLMEETLPQARIALGEARVLGAKVLVTPPRYYEANLGNEGLQSYYQAIADANQAQVWLYHVPQNTKAQLPLSAVAQLASHPNITGIKDSSGELSRMAFYKSQDLELELYTGHASTFLGALALGARGGILAVSNLAPKPFRLLKEAWQSGAFAEAQELQAQVEPFARILAQGGFVLLKQAMRYVGLPAGYPRPPYPAESPVWNSFKPMVDEFKANGWTVG